MKALALVLGLMLGGIALLPATAHAQPMFVTGYTCPPYCGSTADGTPVGLGVAACPPSMPFGTTLRIEGLGEVVCHDRGPDHVDVFMSTLAECYAITGWRDVEVVG